MGPPKPTTVEEWAVYNSKKMTPDELISAGVIRGFAKDFDSWKLNHYWTNSNGLKPVAYRSSDREAKTSIAHKEKKCKVVFFWEKKEEGDYYSRSYSYELTGVHVNDVELDMKQGKLIFDSWEKIKEHHEAIKAAAAEAKRQMELNEKKWNIAEDLLDMKRLPSGALVPKVKVEDEAPHTREGVC